VLREQVEQEEVSQRRSVHFTSEETELQAAVFEEAAGIDDEQSRGYASSLRIHDQVSTPHTPAAPAAFPAHHATSTLSSPISTQQNPTLERWPTSLPPSGAEAQSAAATAGVAAAASRAAASVASPQLLASPSNIPEPSGTFSRAGSSPLQQLASPSLAYSTPTPDSNVHSAASAAAAAASAAAQGVPVLSTADTLNRRKSSGGASAKAAKQAAPLPRVLVVEDSLPNRSQ